MPLKMILRSTLLSIAFATLLLSRASLCLAQPGSTPTVISLKDPKLSAVLVALRTGVPQNVSPSLLPEIRESSSQLPTQVREALHSRMLRADSLGNVLVDIQIDQSESAWRSELTAAGFRLLVFGSPHPKRSAGDVYFAQTVVEGWLPASSIERVENLAFVRYVGLPSYGITNAGGVDSQGDHILQADLTRTALNVDGTGVRVGVISSGIAGVFATGCTSSCSATAMVPSPINLGDLPAAIGTRNGAGILTSASGGITAMSFRTDGDLEDTIDGSGGAEGTAMLEIVHDLAPGASLYFANAETSLQFEQAVDALASKTDVVVDDISWFTPPYDGTSSVSSNTSDALNNNAYPIRAYFTDAGNWAQDHYQGLYTDSLINGTPFTGEAGDLHLFQGTMGVVVPAPGVTTDNGSYGKVPFDPVIAIPPGQSISVYLAWNDPELASTNDYDLFLVPLSCAGIANNQPIQPCSISGQALEKGVDPQTGVQNPAEQLSWMNSTGSTATVGIIIENVGNAAQAKTFDLFVNGYGAKKSAPNHNFNTESGSVAAENDAIGGVVTVGAINQAQCANPESCTGLLEVYSSQGPTGLTPQSMTGTMKPDLVAVDQVCVDGAGGFNSTAPASMCPPSQPTGYTPVLFGGTSAAAPHSAAVAALALETYPCLLANDQVITPANARTKLRTALTSTAHPIPAYFEAVPNSIEGAGLVDSYDATISLIPPVNALSSSATGTTPITASAVSNGGASVAISPANTDPNSCPIASISWTGTCGTGTAQGAHATLQCPIGTNTVQVATSNNGHSYQPAAQVPNSTIIVTDFVMGANPSTLTVQPGATLLYTVTAQSTAQGQFANPITLSCSSGLPANATCSFSPTTITATNSTGTSTTTSSGSNLTSTLTIYTSGLAELEPRKGDQSSGNAPIWIVACVLPFFLGRKSWSRAGFTRNVVYGLTALAMLTAINACSSKTSSTTPTTYNVTITGASNQLQHTTTISFMVQ
jgi:hypothetical protein